VIRHHLVQVSAPWLVAAVVGLGSSGCSRLLPDWKNKYLFPIHLLPAPHPTLYSSQTVAIELSAETRGRVVSWFVPAPGVTSTHPSPVVIFFHGNRELIDYQENFIRGYQRFGCSVFLPEYRGYGHSAGKPSEKVICADAVRFYDELVKRADVDRARIVFHGRSLGGAVAANLATRRKPAGLILQSTFRSFAAVARHFHAPGLPFIRSFRTDRAIANVDIPVLIFHGTKDEVVPVSHGRKLRGLSPNAAYIEYDCGHNDFPGYGNNDAYWSAIGDFLTRCDVLSQAPK